MIKFSERTNWDASENLLSRMLNKIRKSGQPWINLTESNPTRCGFAYPDGMFEALASPNSRHYIPEAAGSLQARLGVCEYYRCRGYHISEDQVILTSSTSEAYSYLFRLLANPGDTVLFPRPSYPLFQFLADLNDTQLAFYDLAYNQERWAVDTSSVTEHISTRTKAVVTVNPNNPTGSYISKDEIVFLNGVCKKHDLALISDEVFYDYAFDDKKKTTLVKNDQCLTFVMNGLSKVLGLPQMKLSWIVVNGHVNDVRQALKRLEMIADTYLSVNTPVQMAWPLWVNHLDAVQSGISARVKGNYEWLCRRLNSESFVKCLKTEGGWYVIVEIPDILSEEEWALKFLGEASVYVHPGYFFDADQDCCIVVSLLLTEEQFQDGVERILNLVKIELSKA